MKKIFEVIENKILLQNNTTGRPGMELWKCNKTQAEEGKRPLFKILRNKHSAIESNVNELENRGLNRCPDNGYHNFKRYIGMAVCAYNFKKNRCLPNCQRAVNETGFHGQSSSIIGLLIFNFLTNNNGKGVSFLAENRLF